MGDSSRLEALRAEIGAIDRELVRLIGRRIRVATQIGAIKSRRGMPVLDPAREAEVVRRAAEAAREEGVDPELARAVLWRIIDHARDAQQS